MDSGFDRVVFKEKAKQVLKRNYWIPFVVCLIAGFLGGNWNSRTGFSFSVSSPGGSSSSGSSSSSSIDDLNETINNIQNFNAEEWAVFLVGAASFIVIFAVIWLLMFALIFAVGSFLGAPVGVGLRRFFMCNRDESKETDIGVLFSSFRKNKYMKIVKTMFFYNLKMWAWGLLFWIPGVIKYYQYYFVPYIMAENPDISTKRAFEISKYMTDGKKWDIFVLELSFIGWTLLSMVVCCGLSSVFLTPYLQATYAEMYEERREMALMSGFCGKEELCGFND